MKKHGSKIFAVLLALTMVFAMTVASFADTTYTLRVFSGEHGTYGGDATVSGKALNSVVKIDISKVKINDDKYYVKGLKGAGKDDKEFKETADFSRDGDIYKVKVTKDTDCVVTYGVKADAVKYTVNYLDNDGNKLAASKTLYGDVGDMPVVSYTYVDGYVPAANNLTKTLSSDESQNVFTFYYRKAAPGENTTVVVNGNNNANAANGNANANANNAVNDPDNQTPRDLVDLDNEETPMANMDLDEESGLPLGAILGIIAAAIAVGAAILILVAKKRRKDEEAYNE